MLCGEVIRGESFLWVKSFTIFLIQLETFTIFRRENLFTNFSSSQSFSSYNCDGGMKNKFPFSRLMKFLIIPKNFVFEVFSGGF